MTRFATALVFTLMTACDDLPVASPTRFSAASHLPPPMPEPPPVPAQTNLAHVECSDVCEPGEPDCKPCPEK